MSIMNSKLGVIAATGVAAFVGYCIYFDHKRRSAPDFKKKLREKRNKAKSSSGKKAGTTTLPDPRDSQAMQKFFLNEVRLGSFTRPPTSYEKIVRTIYACEHFLDRDLFKECDHHR